MFVVKGYLPGGATVYLSPSTVPPAESSMIAASRDPGIPVAVHEKKAEPSKDVVIGDESSYASLDASLDASLEAPLDEIAFAEERARLDPASVVNLDEELGDAATDEDSASLGEPKGDLAISV